MIKEICRNEKFLKKKSLKAVKSDVTIGQDLLDTLRAHRAECVGMAANMIGVNKRIIIVSLGMSDMVMYNPIIIRKEYPYITSEGCLSLNGVRNTMRFREIEVTYEDSDFVSHTSVFRDDVAQIIQHECDHLNGIII